MFDSDYKWQHDYVRLAFDTDFHFEKYKSDNLNKNRISAIDIERIIEDRDFATIESCIPHITKFVLDAEQAQVLDASFVKTFRLSQLAIQYLLYCKKYLDNTLVILKEEIKKVREENKELSLFVDDLKGHVSTLMKELEEKPTFRCEQCNKIFSTEEFLQSHIKRRHSIPVLTADTDKLHMEIKELKGRLNSAEKMIQKEHCENDSNFKESEMKKIEELQQKFEELRLQVQSELKILQTQHNFQEKYEKLLEKMTFQENSRYFEKVAAGDHTKRRETTTQTDLEKTLHEPSPNFISKFEEKENIHALNRQQKEQSLETKVTTSLEKIENQMQSFWKKLNEMETYKKKDTQLYEEKNPKSVRTRVNYTVRNLTLEEEQSKAKYSPKKRRVSIIADESPINKNDGESDRKHQKSKKECSVTEAIKTRKSGFGTELMESTKSIIQKVEDDTTTSETFATESEMTAESAEEELTPKPAPRRYVQPFKNTTEAVKNSKKNLEDVLDPELLQRFRIETEDVLNGRLQALGVSPDWKGLPTRSFERALEIINHQANLLRKTHPNFDYISTLIEKNITKKIEENKTKQKSGVKIKSKHLSERKTDTNGNKPEVAARSKALSPKIEIRNRKMYETDSESENIIQPKETLRQFSAPYNAVIQELKSVTSKYDSSDTEIITVKNDQNVKNEDNTKGVLKNYPSIGSLTKKKVLFNLDTDDDDKKDQDVSVKDAGSTTSITSSVFDPTPHREEEQKEHVTKKEREKDIEDLSDFDFSDM